MSEVTFAKVLYDALRHDEGSNYWEPVWVEEFSEDGTVCLDGHFKLGKVGGLMWQPIETAPRHNRARDGSTNQPHVIGCEGDRVGGMRHYDGDWYWESFPHEANPTHWMPFPDALAAQVET